MNIFNFFKRILTPVTIVLVFMTSTLNVPFNYGAYEYSSVSTVAGLETLTRAQGVTNDGESFIFSGKSTLEKTTPDCQKILALNLKAIPDELREGFGSAHIGGISFYGGKVYAGVEDSKEWLHPLVVIYDAETLEYTGEYHEISNEILTRGIPWVAVDGENGILYTGDSCNHTEIFKFDLETFEYKGKITMDMTAPSIQGGEYSDGKLYVGTNDMTRAVYSIDVKTGETKKLFDRITYEYKYIDNFGGEGEDLTVLKMDDGTFIHTLQIGATFIDASLRHYKIEEYST